MQNISEKTKNKVQEAKKYIQKKYNLAKISQQQKVQQWKAFQQRVKMLGLTLEQRQQAKNIILHKQMQTLRKLRQRITRKNFQHVAVIGRGAFGEVRLCRQKKSGRPVAIKCLKKQQMIKKNQQSHLMTQRNLLAGGGQWIVTLLNSFQDRQYLYLVMEYLPGGDLMNLLIQRNTLVEEDAKFYAAEILLAIQSLHNKGYIHRDIKPDNVLIDKFGHIRLSDFGLCTYNVIQSSQSNENNLDQKTRRKKNGEKRRRMAFSAVGTPDYIAPQMLRKTGYFQSVDWWAFGIVIYEMLIGFPPFASENNEDIYYKIQNSGSYLYFPPQIPLSEQVMDLIVRLLNDNESMRLGKKGVNEIKNHIWFKNIDWQNIKSITPPFVPNISSQFDSSYFDSYDTEQKWQKQQQPHENDYDFLGYTFKYRQQNQNINNCLDEIERNQNQQRQKQRQRCQTFNMKKKHKIILTSHHQNHKNYQNKFIIQKLPRKSKSPLGQKDTNRLRTKQSQSKSPFKTQHKQRLSNIPKKLGPLTLNLQNLTVGNALEIVRTTSGRKSGRKLK